MTTLKRYAVVADVVESTEKLQAQINAAIADAASKNARLDSAQLVPIVRRNFKGTDTVEYTAMLLFESNEDSF